MSTTATVSAASVVAIKDDAVSALINLGYKKPDATEAVERATRELDFDAPRDVVIKAALAKAKGTKPMPTNGPTPPAPIHSSNGKATPLPVPVKPVNGNGNGSSLQMAPPKPPGPQDSKTKTVGKMESIEVQTSDLLAALLCIVATIIPVRVANRRLEAVER